MSPDTHIGGLSYIISIIIYQVFDTSSHFFITKTKSPLEIVHCDFIPYTKFEYTQTTNDYIFVYKSMNSAYKTKRSGADSQNSIQNANEWR